jgi:cephalosporin-C deacetylase
MTLDRSSPESFQSSLIRPPDFDEFWSAILDEAAGIPLNPSLTHVPQRSTEEVDVFEIHYDSLDGVRIAGWYCRPTEPAFAPPYPGLLIVPGYVSEPTVPKTWAMQGYAAVGVAPRGKLRSNQQFNPGYPGLLTHNIVDRHTYSYRGFYIDACRAVDFLQSRPEVDHSRIGVHGSSQGGGLAIMTSALRRDAISCAAAGCPYLCGIMDAITLTRSFPYEEINEYLRENPDHEPWVRETVAYFDGVNHAASIQCPTLIYIGLADDVCPPETGYAVYHAINAPKEMLAYERCAHDAGREWAAPEVERFLARWLRPGEPSRQSV